MAIHLSEQRLNPELSDSAPTFLMLYCPDCARDVLSARDLNPQDELVDICVHCARQLERAPESARWVGADTLSENGYFVEGHDTPEASRGGGGCRGGSCGVRQPD